MIVSRKCFFGLVITTQESDFTTLIVGALVSFPDWELKPSRHERRNPNMFLGLVPDALGVLDVLLVDTIGVVDAPGFQITVSVPDLLWVPNRVGVPDALGVVDVPGIPVGGSALNTLWVPCTLGVVDAPEIPVGLSALNALWVPKMLWFPDTLEVEGALGLATTLGVVGGAGIPNWVAGPGMF